MPPDLESQFLVFFQVGADFCRLFSCCELSETLAGGLAGETQHLHRRTESGARRQGEDTRRRLDPKAVLVVEPLHKIPSAIGPLHCLSSIHEILDGREELIADPFKPFCIAGRDVEEEASGESEVGADQWHKKRHHRVSEEIPNTIPHNVDIKNQISKIKS